MQYDIADAVRLGLAAVDDRVERTVEAAMDPWRPAAREHSPDVTIEQLRQIPRRAELQNAAGDNLTTAGEGEVVYIMATGHWCRVPAPAADGPFTFAVEPGFPFERILAGFLRPALQLAAGARGIATVHGAAVEMDGRGVVIAGWSETGKTETALAFMERGARFLSDKWTFAFPDRRIACFPISVGIRRWALGYTPTLRRELPTTARAQFAMAALGGAAARLTAPARYRGGITAKVSNAFGQIVTLAERASLSPSELSRVYGQPPPTGRVPLGALVLLRTTTSGAPSAELRDPAWAAQRLVRSASYERRSYLDLGRRIRYLQADTDLTRLPEIIERREEEQVLPLLEGIPIIDVQTPFPCDPRRIVDVVQPLL